MNDISKLVSDLRKCAGECTVDSCPDLLEVRRLLYAAAEVLEQQEGQMVSNKLDNPGVFLSGNDIVNQIDAINRKRISEGKQPL